MAEGIDGAIDALKDILNSPDAAENISAMLSGFGLPGADQKSQNDLPISPQMLAKVMEAYKSIGKADDRRVTLLRAVRPFMRETRKGEVDMAIRLLTILRLMPLLKDFQI